MNEVYQHKIYILIKACFVFFILVFGIVLLYQICYEMHV